MMAVSSPICEGHDARTPYRTCTWRGVFGVRRSRRAAPGAPRGVQRAVRCGVAYLSLLFEPIANFLLHIIEFDSYKGRSVLESSVFEGHITILLQGDPLVLGSNAVLDVTFDTKHFQRALWQRRWRWTEAEAEVEVVVMVSEVLVEAEVEAEAEVEVEVR